MALIREQHGVAAQVMERMGVSHQDVLARVNEIIGPGESSPSGHIPFTPRCKKVLELSLREALPLGHNYIGTEHILLGLIREGEGGAADILIGLGVDLAKARTTTIDILSRLAKPVEPEQPEEEPVPEDSDPWWLVGYTNADGSGSSAVIQAERWETAGPLILVGGHAFATSRVVTILRVGGPPSNNTIVPAGMKPLAPKPPVHPPAGTMVNPAPDSGTYTPAEIEERKAAIRQATYENGLAHGLDLGGHRTERAKDADKAFKKRWGTALGKAISMAVQEGGIVFVPDERSELPRHISPRRYNEDDILDMLNIEDADDSPAPHDPSMPPEWW